MAATLATRKPIDQITVADLVDFPIWEFCLDEEGVEGMDETWVLPLRCPMGLIRSPWLLNSRLPQVSA
jgi:hypothetical protein